MWRSRIDFQRGVLDDLGREHGRRADRHDLVVVAVDDERRRVELLQVFSLVGFGERLDTIVVCAQRPAVAEDHRLAAAPVLIIKIYGAGIFFTNTDVWHLKLSFLSCCFLQTDGDSGSPQRDSLLAFPPASVRPLTLCKKEAVESVTRLCVFWIPLWAHPETAPSW